MSDPVTNAEVEDVLSSIRRLVSEDKRPLQTKAKPVVSDRLVLTPALRVAEPEDEPTVENTVEEAQDWSEEDAAFEAAHGDDMADYPRPRKPEPDVSSDRETVTAAQILAAAAGDGRRNADLEDPALDYESDPYNFSDEADQDGEGVHDRRSDTELFDDEMHEQTEDEAVAVRGGGDAAPVAHDAQAATLSAKIEALETAIGNISDTWEPDSPGDGDYSGTDAPAMAWEDDVDQAVSTARLHNLPENEDREADAASFFREKAEGNRTAENRTGTGRADVASGATAAATEERFALSDDDQVLDEEALRDLVSEIVRAELQGALGERITRNVRKLVRREIHRALTAQELE